MAFKAVSTLDSMIGHRTPRYEHFGKLAARLDDAANLIPARLTALLFLAQAPSRQAWTIYGRDKQRHASPNAGHPEAAIAAVLGVQLGGPSTYDGIPPSGSAPCRRAPTPRPPKTPAELLSARATWLFWPPSAWPSEPSKENSQLLNSQLSKIRSKNPTSAIIRPRA